jgi:DNA-directed RNA polymerase subunit RPC12/RpoP
MPTHSIYEFTCICGRNFQTDDPSDIRCPDCGRALVLEWRPAHPGGICAAHIEEARP